ncbi:hypothetical protein K461DRAFT_119396 [Myriangium duriaei CBS 260.36]|uniref:Uncharacterized protein n=1 Tax=Myriangium duriaei CBS 260.36 TaxID=1168546 RepID=A0A9P4ML91_9PEZI|nr:hypothetical protein K461DRAFT_119396 [Myriangium duriaei CBS 260.36]
MRSTIFVLFLAQLFLACLSTVLAHPVATPSGRAAASEVPVADPKDERAVVGHHLDGAFRPLASIVAHTLAGVASAGQPEQTPASKRSPLSWNHLFNEPHAAFSAQRKGMAEAQPNEVPAVSRGAEQGATQGRVPNELPPNKRELMDGVSDTGAPTDGSRGSQGGSQGVAEGSLPPDTVPNSQGTLEGRASNELSPTKCRSGQYVSYNSTSPDEPRVTYCTSPWLLYGAETFDHRALNPTLCRSFPQSLNVSPPNIWKTPEEWDAMPKQPPRNVLPHKTVPSLQGDVGGRLASETPPTKRRSGDSLFGNSPSSDEPCVKKCIWPAHVYGLNRPLCKLFDKSQNIDSLDEWYRAYPDLHSQKGQSLNSGSGTSTPSSGDSSASTTEEPARVDRPDSQQSSSPNEKRDFEPLFPTAAPSPNTGHPRADAILKALGDKTLENLRQEFVAELGKKLPPRVKSSSSGKKADEADVKEKSGLFERTNVPRLVETGVLPVEWPSSSPAFGDQRESKVKDKLEKRPDEADVKQKTAPTEKIHCSQAWLWRLRKKDPDSSTSGPEQYHGEKSGLMEKAEQLVPKKSGEEGPWPPFKIDHPCFYGPSDRPECRGEKKTPPVEMREKVVQERSDKKTKLPWPPCLVGNPCVYGSRDRIRNKPECQWLYNPPVEKREKLVLTGMPATKGERNGTTATSTGLTAGAGEVKVGKVLMALMAVGVGMVVV